MFRVIASLILILVIACAVYFSSGGNSDTSSPVPAEENSGLKLN